MVDILRAVVLPLPTIDHTHCDHALLAKGILYKSTEAQISRRTESQVSGTNSLPSFRNGTGAEVGR